MPLYATDYTKSIIYKLCCKDLLINDIYIGHTTNFNDRKKRHKYNCNNENEKRHNLYVYQFIRNNGGWDNWVMIKIEDYPCNNKLDVEKREREFIELYKATLNSYIPLGADEKILKERIKIKRDLNKDIVNEKRRNDKKFCECCKVYCLKINFPRHLRTDKHLKNQSIS